MDNADKNYRNDFGERARCDGQVKSAWLREFSLIAGTIQFFQLLEIQSVVRSRTEPKHPIKTRE